MDENRPKPGIPEVHPDQTGGKYLAPPGLSRGKEWSDGMLFGSVAPEIVQESRSEYVWSAGQNA